ncbi:LD-carboxypeptidase [Metamycoplasma cloacale]|uniref:LD-carboxypeptidase n=1 Tax=Metamycoplasma cloacale TaxID=92401 RepID=A0A2Z4LLB5_9BACT|nr:S66 peptidase family protein [Metamycoplasma cloacale]AWX42542.1 LD-carboxypeptidase [Metamycoplasma cloacale]VEU79786.1 LD-carboxypeptidase [Metamycoplasma cloacale]
MKLNKKDLIAIISLSSGILGEQFCDHQRVIGEKRLKEMKLNFIYTPNALKGVSYIDENPDKRAEDLIWSFENKDVKAILCALGGFDTYRTVNNILSNKENILKLRSNFKFFIGYSDTTINHLMLTLLGIKSYYGIAYLTCIAELDKQMLKYTKRSFKSLFQDKEITYKPARYWYKERTDFSIKQINISREKFKEKHGFELLQGQSKFQGILTGGCLETIASLLDKENNYKAYEVNKKWHLFDETCDFKNKVLLLETSEEKPQPMIVKQMLELIESTNVFRVANGVIIGKPQDEQYYDEYKSVYKEFFSKYPQLPVLYNINIGHAYPKMLLEINGLIKIDAEKQTIKTRIKN